MIGLVTYGFAVVNKKTPAVEGPTREDEVNKLTKNFNSEVINLSSTYVNALTGFTTSSTLTDSLYNNANEAYNKLRSEYDQQVSQVAAPPAKKNSIRDYWNKVVYGGIFACLAGCMGSTISLGSGEENIGPQKLMGETTAWNADNIPMPHLEDELQYVANPDNVLDQATVDSMNVILQELDKNLDIETAFAVVNYVEGAEAFRLAQDMGNKYGVGRHDRGLVVVMAYGDHDINISPGHDLEADLSDEKCGELLDDFAIPFLKRNQPDSAMLYLTRALREVLRHQSELSPVYEAPMSDDDRNAAGAMGGFSILTGLLAFFSSKMRKKGLLGLTTPQLIQPLANPISKFGSYSDGYSGSGYSSGTSSSRRSSSSYRSSSSRSSRGGSYGGGHFGGGGASRKW